MYILRKLVALMKVIKDIFKDKNGSRHLLLCKGTYVISTTSYRHSSQWRPLTTSYRMVRRGSASVSCVLSWSLRSVVFRWSGRRTTRPSL